MNPCESGTRPRPASGTSRCPLHHHRRPLHQDLSLGQALGRNNRPLSLRRWSANQRRRSRSRSKSTQRIQQLCHQRRSPLRMSNPRKLPTTRGHPLSQALRNRPIPRLPPRGVKAHRKTRTFHSGQSDHQRRKRRIARRDDSLAGTKTNSAMFGVTSRAVCTFVALKLCVLIPVGFRIRHQLLYYAAGSKRQGVLGAR